MNSQALHPEHCSHGALLQRGWTEAGIKRFLKAPDKTAPNPHYRRGADMKLYLLTRVESMEKSEEYLIFCKKNKTRKQGAISAVRTKKEKLLRDVAGWEIHITRQNLTDVLQDAISSYNERRADRSEDGFIYEPASLNSDKEFLYRITVNFLRHRCSPYERKLTETAGKVGTKEAYILLNQNIFKRISHIFPELQAECDRQLEEKIRQYLEESNNLHVH
ncbi:MAG: hypothetical protein PHW62_00320 [Candidatus Ratteibacteria bacterium]|nr:hypothetical protein [Candidatus Ratteibacteria bacterium]